MINKNLFKYINEFCEERDLDKNDIFDALEKGIVSAYKREVSPNAKSINAKVIFNEEKDEYYICRYYNVVKNEEELVDDNPSYITLEEAKKIKRGAKVGEYFEVKVNLKPEEFGRIAAHTAKQVFNQEINRLEKDKIYQYYLEHQDEMITGQVVSINENNIVFQFEYDITAAVPKVEIPRDECYIGAKIKLYLSKVELQQSKNQKNPTNKGLKIYVSRSDKNLIKRLFETYIPEVKDGIIEIVGIARDPGDRTKVCVKTDDPNVDPLGSCLGPKGRRIKDIVDALGGEKIDVYEYSEDPKELIHNSLQPAEVIGVQYDAKEKQATVVVPDDNTSLAIGKKGQNVRLAVQSSGWKIDIKSVKQALEEGIEF